MSGYDLPIRDDNEREWYANVGRIQEKERIIKLLEDPATMSNWWAMPDKSLGLYGNLRNYVIELIKGETNE
jgi:hypothetical protein